MFYIYYNYISQLHRTEARLRYYELDMQHFYALFKISKAKF